MEQKQPQLHRGLEERHISLMSLGAAIGVGLFLGSASAIEMAGPAILLGYAVSGAIMFLHHACAGGNGRRTPGRWFVQPLCLSIFRSARWLLDRLELLVFMGGHMHRRNYGCRHLHAVLVPGHAALGVGACRAGAHDVHQLSRGESVRGV